MRATLIVVAPPEEVRKHRWSAVWPWFIWGPILLAAAFVIPAAAGDDLALMGTGLWVATLGMLGPWRSVYHRGSYGHWPRGAGRCRRCHRW